MKNHPLLARHINEWTDEVGTCLWWTNPLCGLPYIGTPRHSDFPEDVRHWTPLERPWHDAKTGALYRSEGVAWLVDGPEKCPGCEGELEETSLEHGTRSVIGKQCRDCKNARNEEAPKPIAGASKECNRPPLLPCPFCAGGAAEFTAPPELSGRDRQFYVACRCCAAQGGWARTAVGAARLWNTRATAGGSVVIGPEELT